MYKNMMDFSSCQLYPKIDDKQKCICYNIINVIERQHRKAEWNVFKNSEYQIWHIYAGDYDRCCAYTLQHT